MPGQSKTCTGCGGADFRVMEDHALICRHCGLETPPISQPAPEPAKTYNRGTKVESGSNSFWEGLASLLLFESLGGGCVASFIVMVLVIGGVTAAWLFSGSGEARREERRAREAARNAEADAKKVSSSMQLTARAADKVQREARETGRILHRDEANAKMTPRNDAWGSPLVYEAVDDNTFTIRSLGKDRKPQTEDDIVEQRKLRLPMKTGPPGP